VATALTLEVAAGGLSLLKDVGHLSFNYTKLDLVGKSLLDLQELHQYPSLQILDVSDNQIADATQLGTLPALLSAKLDQNKIQSMESVDQMEHLQLLSLKANEITQLPLLKMPTLHYLNIDGPGNEITTLSGALTACTKLVTIEARENKLTTTEGIEELEELENAYFSNNEIVDLRLGTMPQMRTLVLSTNQIASLTAFQDNVSNLEHLDLSSNAVASAKEFANLSGLKQLRTLTFAENPVTGVDKYRNHIYAVLPHLESLDGEPFADEDREPPPEIVDEEAPAE